MSFIGKAVGSVLGSITGTTAATRGAEAAAATQAGAAAAGIEEERRQFDALVELMSPFVTAGTGALAAQQDILGLGAPGAQEAAITGIEQGPLFQALARQGEEALLQQASATGGLRGGNIQGALAQFRPQMLQQQIQQRFGNLGGLTGIGQASAAGQAAAGQQTGASIADLLAQQGAATAGGQIARGTEQQRAFGSGLSLAGTIGGFF